MIDYSKQSFYECKVVKLKITLYKKKVESYIFISLTFYLHIIATLGQQYLWDRLHLEARFYH